MISSMLLYDSSNLFLHCSLYSLERGPGGDRNPEKAVTEQARAVLCH